MTDAEEIEHLKEELKRLQQARRRSQMSETVADFAWLIEAPGPRYLAVRKGLGDYRGEFYWTDKPNDALRFFNKAQADFTGTAIRRLLPDLWAFAGTLGEAWPREHKWVT